MHVTEPGNDHGHTLTEEKVAKAFEEMRGTKVSGEESDDEDDDVEIVSVLGRHNLLTDSDAGHERYIEDNQSEVITTTRLIFGLYEYLFGRGRIHADARLL